MKKILMLSLILCSLPFWAEGQSTKQLRHDALTGQYKNEFLAGFNIAALGQNFSDYDIISFFYRNEYIRSLNHHFSLGVGLGFFNGRSKDKVMITNASNNSSYSVNAPDNASIIFYSLTAYYNIVNSRKSLLRFGVGYSARSVNAYYIPKEFIGVGMPYYTAEKQIHSFGNGVIFHLGYGYRVSPHFISSIEDRIYTKGNYISIFSTAGINISYLF